jgi:hypothetical protein
MCKINVDHMDKLFAATLEDKTTMKKRKSEGEMVLYILPSCCKCQEVIKLFTKLEIDVKVINIFDTMNADRTLTWDNGLPVLEENNEWLDYEMIMKRYNKGV